MSKNALYFTLLSIIVVVLFVTDIFVGSVGLSAGSVWDSLVGNPTDKLTASIIQNFRLPKAVVAVLCGGALSACGLQMQTLFRNPLADPFVLGVSSGASLGVSLFLLGAPILGVSVANTTLQGLGLVGSAWVGGAVVLTIIIAISARIKDIMVILIIGMMFGSAASAIVQVLQYLGSESALKSYVVWGMGSLGGVSAGQLKVLVPIILVGLAMSVGLIKSLNLLLLGENYARTMGLKIKRVRGLIFVSTILLAGTVTAFCGPIGFVGIAVPHLARMVFARSDHRTLMPASIVLGVAVMLLCDIVSQLPGQSMTLPINTITALLGIPVIIFVVVRNRKIF